MTHIFTGIVEEKGQIERLELRGNSGKLTISCKKVLEGTKLGDSIAVNGICLTVTDMTSTSFTADVMAETIRRSSLSKAHQGDAVDLERAMDADGRFGGHILTGHIDGVGTINQIIPEENAIWYFISAPEHIMSLVVEKGSIAIDGISLTVANVFSTNFAVSIIPHTLEETVLANRRPGDQVNLENDPLGKYVARLLGQSGVIGGTNEASYGRSQEPGLTFELLSEQGF